MPAPSTQLRCNNDGNIVARISNGAVIPEGNFVRFDFQGPRPLSHEVIEDVKVIHKSFMDTFGDYLALRLHASVHVRIASINKFLYSNFVLSIPVPSCVFLCRVSGMDATLVLEFSPTLALMIVDRLLGGSGAGESHLRELTLIEQEIVKTIVRQAVDALGRSWKNIPDPAVTVDRYERGKNFAHLMPEAEDVYVICFEIYIDDQPYQLNCCFPRIVWEAVLHNQTVQNSSIPDMRGHDEEILRRLLGTTVCATATLYETTLTFRELVNLSPGDTIKTSVPTNSDIKVLVGNTCRFSGNVRVSEGRRAVEVITVLQGTNKERGDNGGDQCS